MQELNSFEIEQVAGAAGLFSPIGNIITGTVTLANAFLNTPIVSSVGQVFNEIGFGLQYVHQAADTLGYIGFRAIDAVGEALGGDPATGYHYNKEW